jgi:branched-chain amino acid transport system permease protein
LNIAHGGILVLGAAVATFAVKFLHVQLWLTVLLIPLAFLGVGWLFERAFVRPLAGRPPERILIGSILITFGVALAIEAFLGFYWARFLEPQPTFALSFPAPRVEIGGLSLSGTRLTILAFVTGAIGLLHLFLKRTALGQSARALSQDYEGALIVGINPRLVSVTIVTLGVSITALSGTLFVLATPLEAYDGMRLTLIALTVIVIGGVGSLPGALLGGVLLGVGEVITAFVTGAVWSPLTSLAIFFGVLVWRPAGLLRVRHP